MMTMRENMLGHGVSVDNEAWSNGGETVFTGPCVEVLGALANGHFNSSSQKTHDDHFALKEHHPGDVGVLIPAFSGKTFREWICQDKTKANYFIFDLEESLHASWENYLHSLGQLKEYGKIQDELAPLYFLPRSLKRLESNVRIDGHTAPAPLVDLAVYITHCWKNDGPARLMIPDLDNIEDAKKWAKILRVVQKITGQDDIQLGWYIDKWFSADHMREVIQVLSPWSLCLQCGRSEHILGHWAQLHGINKPGESWPEKAYGELLQTTREMNLPAYAGPLPLGKGVDPKILQEAYQYNHNLGFRGQCVSHPHRVRVAKQVIIEKKAGKGRWQGPTWGQNTIVELENKALTMILFHFAWMKGKGQVMWQDRILDKAAYCLALSHLRHWLREEIVLDSGEQIGLDVIETVFQKASGAALSELKEKKKLTPAKIKEINVFVEEAALSAFDVVCDLDGNIPLFQQSFMA